MFELPNKPQSPLHIIINAWRFWYLHWGELLILACVPVLISAIPYLIFPELSQFHFFGTRQAAVSGVYFLVPYIIFMFYLFSVILLRANALLHKTQETFSKSLMRALKCLPAVIVGIVFYDISLILSFAALLIPGFIFMVLLSMYFPFIILEGKGPISAYRESYVLVTKHFFHTAIILLGMAVVIVFIVFWIDVSAYELWTLSTSDDKVIHLGHVMIRSLVGLFFYPIFCSTLLLLFHDLKLREKQGDEG